MAQPYDHVESYYCPHIIAGPDCPSYREGCIALSYKYTTFGLILNLTQRNLPAQTFLGMADHGSTCVCLMRALLSQPEVDNFRRVAEATWYEHLEHILYLDSGRCRA